MTKLTSSGKIKKIGLKLVVICVWLLIWQVLSMVIGEEIFLPAPASVFVAFVQLLITLDFWQTVLYSSLRIVAGFGLALITGILLAVLAYNSRIIRELVSPAMLLMKAVPVASFIILALLWVNKKNLSVLASFIMVLPLIYTSVAQGLQAADEKLLQMAKVFCLNGFKKMHAIYVPSVLPYLTTGLSVGIGFCWKSGIAAEVIGIPSGSIGEKLYEAKLYLMTKELFSWTIVIIAISILFEKAVMYLLSRVQKRSGKGGASWTSN